MAPKLFTKESDLCAAFINDVGKVGGWAIYPETAGFDILLSRLSDGFQIGIEAKLSLNMKVICQALNGIASPSRVALPGPDCRAVLVPDDSCAAEASTLCAHLGVTVLTYRPGRSYGTRKTYAPNFLPILPRHHKAFGQPGEGRWPHDLEWFEWAPAERLKLPDYMPDVVAGNPSPITLTDWKIRAIRLSILLDERAITRNDLAHLGLSPSRWIAPDGWLSKAPGGGWERGKRTPDFKAQHPIVYEQIRADRAKWDKREQARMI